MRIKRGGAATALAVVVAVAVAACGGSTPAPKPSASGTATAAAAPTPAPPPKPPPSPVPVLLHGAAASGLLPWTPAVKVRGQVAAWIKRVPASDGSGSTITVLRFDQHLVRLSLHAGSTDPGGTGWLHGPMIGPAERHLLVSAFNGAFRLDTGAGGFMLGGRVAVPLADGKASVVTYRDGTTDIGAWNGGTVPAPGRPIESVRQDLQPLVVGGQPAATVDSCVEGCWGATLGGVLDVARSALGITGDGQLVWAAGEGLSVRALADALAGAGVLRGIELDINPAWVAGMLYSHAGGAVTPVEILAGQNPPLDLGLAPYSRDFFTVSSRP